MKLTKKIFLNYFLITTIGITTITLVSCSTSNQSFLVIKNKYSYSGTKNNKTYSFGGTTPSGYESATNEKILSLFGYKPEGYPNYGSNIVKNFSNFDLFRLWTKQSSLLDLNNTDIIFDSNDFNYSYLNKMVQAIIVSTSSGIGIRFTEEQPDSVINYVFAWVR